ncbi:hypothetical protein ARMGADRAFT_1034115 [Armillaria gallica]|uniref:Uncharacterized protein n=1 Tax=Armillaria gallica TaxID=47427 RepID=A0A2H3CYT6_ARMGA|nr:hypothetical protein ARMGADRAFT_1034115 [Armillaria gallica]
MRIKDLVKIIDYSKHKCSSEEVEKSTITAQELMQMIKHGFTRAFFTSGFTLWTRNFELCGLQARDIEWDLQGPVLYNVPYFRVHLDGCKGWQSKQGWDSPLESNYYNIYAQPDSPDIDIWAIGEHLQSGHGDALYPIPKEADKTFMGDHVLEKPITTAKFHVFADAVLSWLSQSQPTCVCQVHTQVLLSSFMNPTPTHIVGEMTPESTPSQMPLPNPESNLNIMTLVVLPRSLEGSASSIGLGLSHCGQAPPIPGVAIPDIGKGLGAWKKAVKQWEEGDPAQGLLPL